MRLSIIILVLALGCTAIPYPNEPEIVEQTSDDNDIQGKNIFADAANLISGFFESAAKDFANNVLGISPDKIKEAIEKATKGLTGDAAKQAMNAALEQLKKTGFDLKSIFGGAGNKLFDAWLSSGGAKLLENAKAQFSQVTGSAKDWASSSLFKGVAGNLDFLKNYNTTLEQLTKAMSENAGKFTPDMISKFTENMKKLNGTEVKQTVENLLNTVKASKAFSGVYTAMTKNGADFFKSDFFKDVSASTVAKMKGKLKVNGNFNDFMNSMGGMDLKSVSNADFEKIVTNVAASKVDGADMLVKQLRVLRSASAGLKVGYQSMMMGLCGAAVMMLMY